jgi:uncharacterized surface protein with fasciclin (FAS1) repeats
MNSKFAVVLAIVAIAVTSAVAGMKNPVVGGQEMYPTKNIIENAVNSADHTTLVAAVKAAGLVETLEGPGPFTVFAPTNEAFAKLPAGTVDSLLKPENKTMLTKVLTYHVVSGRWSASDLKQQIKAGNGTAELTTVEGGKLWASLHDGTHIMLKDEKGGTALVTIPNVFQSNGVIHVIDTVIMPNQCVRKKITTKAALSQAAFQLLARSSFRVRLCCGYAFTDLHAKASACRFRALHCSSLN